MKDINLLPEDINKPQTDMEFIEKVKPHLSIKHIIIAGVIILTMIITIAIPKIYLKILNDRSNVLQGRLLSQKYMEIKSVNSQLASISNDLAIKADVLSFIDKQSYSINEMLECVKHVAPDGTTINSFSYDTNTLKISLKIKNYSQVAEFLLNIKRLGFLTPDKSMQQLSLVKDSIIEFSFNVAMKGGE